MNESEVLRRALALTERATRFVLVTLVETAGSVPQDVGGKLIVTDQGYDLGTVGGGRLEAKAIGLAQQMLQEGSAQQLVDWSLKTDVGMTCGGRVKLFFEAMATESWPIIIFGAGHVAQALTRLLVTLPCQTTCIDPRKEWLVQLPEGVRTIVSENPSKQVAKLPDSAFVLCMTQGHRSDLPVLAEIFISGREFPYLGVIGSKAKAKVLHRELIESGVSPEKVSFHCPIGLPIGTNHPAEIAISIVAQLLEVRDAKAP